MTTTSDVQIRELVALRAQATRDKDVDAAMSYFAEDIVSFDVVNPLQYSGSKAMRTRTGEWFSSFEGPIGYVNHELTVAAGEDVAFIHSLNQVDATRKDGQALKMWWRSTVCYRKIGGKWMVTHEHNSVPFDVETGKASLGLEP